MNTVLNISEQEFEKGVCTELEPVLKLLVQRVIHRQLANVSRRNINNGVWEPLPGSLSTTMWSVFESEHLNRISPDFKRLNLVSLAHKWEYKTVFAEYERWRMYNM